MKTINPTDERELLERLRDGDHAAFEKIYHLYKRRLVAGGLYLLKSPELTEDLLQDLFLKLWLQRDKIDTEQSLNAYLYKVVQHMAYNMFKKIKRDKGLLEHLLSAVPQAYDHIENYIYKKESQGELLKAIALMPPQQQKVYRMCKLEDKSHEEVSTILKITTGTINIHMSKANQFIKAYFMAKSGSHIATVVLSATVFEILS